LSISPSTHSTMEIHSKFSPIMTLVACLNCTGKERQIRWRCLVILVLR
jgi:hypothetical protein